MGAIPTRRKWTAALLGLAMLAGSSSLALADGKHGQGDERGQHDRQEAHDRFTKVTGFTDLQTGDDWAIPYITQLYLHGLVKGEGHGRFNPKASISQAEAVTMVVRAVYGGDAQAQDAAKGIAGGGGSSLAAWLEENTSWNVKSITHSAGWSLPYLVVAVHDGLLSAQDPFIANQAADRAWSTVLLVKAEVAMGTLTQAQVTGADLSLLNRFTDLASLPADERAYLAAAVAAGLADGYPDHTFRPNASISRAEFTTLVARASDGQAATVVRGTVTAVDLVNQTVTIQQAASGSGSAGGSVTYPVAANVLIYAKVGDQFVSGRDSTLSLADIQVGDQVTLHLGSDGRAALIYDEFNVQDVSGTVTSVTAPTSVSAPYFVDLKTSAGVTFHFSVAPYATVYLKGQPASMSVVQQGVTATVQYHGTEAVSIRVTSTSTSRGSGGSGGTGNVGEQHGTVTLDGTVQQVLGSNAFTMTVNLVDNGTVHITIVYTVTTTSATVFQNTTGVAGLAAGNKVEVQGTGDGYTITATRVTVQQAQ